MRWVRRTLVRLAAVVRGHGAADVDLREEMQAHLEMEIEENMRRGMAPAEARRRALIASGGITQATESVRDQRGLPFAEGLAADLRYALRQFRRTPVATLTIVMVLSLGMGTIVVLFTVLNSMATLPAPGMTRDPSTVRIRGTLRIEGIAGIQPRLLSRSEVEAYADRSDLFRDVAAWADETGLVHADASSTLSIAARVTYTTPNYFDVVGVEPVLGRRPAADGVGTAATSPSAVISHALWEDHFGAARDVLGRALRVNGFPVEIVGVAPPRFVGTEGSARYALWIPLSAYPLLQTRTAAFGGSDDLFLRAAARLRPGVETELASSVVAGVAKRASTGGAGDGGGRTTAGSDGATRPTERGADVVPMLATNSRISQGDDLLVSGAASSGLALLVLLITCTSVSALLVGLSVARRSEVALRLSLGAPRRRVIRQFLTESVLLAFVAAAAGVLLTALGIGTVDASLPDVQLVVNGRVALGTFAVALATGMLFGVSPALAATRTSTADVLKSTSKAVAPGRSWLQGALVVTQITLTQPLLVGLGVVIATMVGESARDATSPAPERIVEIELDAGRLSPEEQSRTIDATVERVAAMPGVVAAIPMQMGTITAPMTVHPADRIPGSTPETVMEAELTAAPAGYFDLYDIPFVRGRDFEPSERAPASPDPASFLAATAVIIDAELAHRLWREADPIGRRMAFGTSGRPDASPLTVVGVVQRQGDGRDRAGGPIDVFVPFAPLNTGVVARTARPALPMLNAMRQVVAAEAPQAPIYRVQTLEQRASSARRTVLRASGAAAGGGLLSLVLSAIGLYAVVSLGVAHRTREIGIRTALGARPSAIAGAFFLRGLALGAVGLALGLPLSMAVARLISTSTSLQLATPPLLGAAIGVVVLAVASIASLIPARRAGSVDPLTALRTD